VAKLLKAYIGNRTCGFLFPNRNGGPLRYNNILRRHLHPLLKSLGVPKTGYHAFRRSRITFLKQQDGLRDALINYWSGHAQEGITDTIYNKLAEAHDYRLREAERVGVSFTLPSMVPMIPSKSPEEKEKAAA
jgi:integrase